MFIDWRNEKAKLLFLRFVPSSRVLIFLSLKNSIFEQTNTKTTMEEVGLAYQWALELHSYLAYVSLAVLFLAVANAIMGFAGNKMFATLGKDYRLSLFALILTHLMLLAGLVLYFLSPSGLNAIQQFGMGGLNSAARLLAVEHPFVNILAVILITIGWSRHKKFLEGKRKFKSIAIFYGLGLVLIMSRIPWGQWLN